MLHSKNQWPSLFVAISVGLFILIGYKAWTIPITHDETATVVHYSQYSIWEIMMYPDPWPNNHILNTLFTKFLIHLFGPEQWVARITNLVFFVVYSFGVWRLTPLLTRAQKLLYPIVVVLFFANPYLLDFFSLCRGYGISTALVTLSFSYMISGLTNANNRHVWGAFFLAMLASYAQFAALIYWCSIVIFIGIFAITSYWNQKANLRLHLVTLFIVSVLYLSLVFVPISKMMETDQFVYWSSEGFITNTVVSLIENWRYGQEYLPGVSDYLLSILFVLGMFIGAGFLLRDRFGLNGIRGNVRMPGFLVILLVFLTIAVNIMQNRILQSPFLSGRTALFYYPLFSSGLMVLVTMGLSGLHLTLKKSVSVAISILLSAHLLLSYSPGSVREWWYDSNTFEVLEFLEDASEKAGKPIDLQVNWHFHRSFYFYSETGKTPWIRLLPYNKDLEEEGRFDFLYVFESDREVLKNEYSEVGRFGGDRVLLTREK